MVVYKEGKKLPQKSSGVYYDPSEKPSNSTKSGGGAEQITTQKWVYGGGGWTVTTDTYDTKTGEGTRTTSYVPTETTKRKLSGSSGTETSPAYQPPSENIITKTPISQATLRTTEQTIKLGQPQFTEYEQHQLRIAEAWKSKTAAKQYEERVLQAEADLRNAQNQLSKYTEKIDGVTYQKRGSEEQYSKAYAEYEKAYKNYKNTVNTYQQKIEEANQAISRANQYYTDRQTAEERVKKIFFESPFGSDITRAQEAVRMGGSPEAAYGRQMSIPPKPTLLEQVKRFGQHEIQHDKESYQAFISDVKKGIQKVSPNLTPEHVGIMLTGGQGRLGLPPTAVDTLLGLPTGVRVPEPRGTKYYLNKPFTEPDSTVIISEPNYETLRGKIKYFTSGLIAEEIRDVENYSYPYRTMGYYLAGMGVGKVMKAVEPSITKTGVKFLEKTGITTEKGLKIMKGTGIATGLGLTGFYAYHVGKEVMGQPSLTSKYKALAPELSSAAAFGLGYAQGRKLTPEEIKRLQKDIQFGKIKTTAEELKKPEDLREIKLKDLGITVKKAEQATLLRFASEAEGTNLRTGITKKYRVYGAQVASPIKSYEILPTKRTHLYAVMGVTESGTPIYFTVHESKIPLIKSILAKQPSYATMYYVGRSGKEFKILGVSYGVIGTDNRTFFTGLKIKEPVTFDVFTSYQTGRYKVLKGEQIIKRGRVTADFFGTKIGEATATLRAGVTRKGSTVFISQEPRKVLFFEDLGNFKATPKTSGMIHSSTELILKPEKVSETFLTSKNKDGGKLTISKSEFSKPPNTQLPPTQNRIPFSIQEKVIQKPYMLPVTTQIFREMVLSEGYQVPTLITTLGTKKKANEELSGLRRTEQELLQKQITKPVIIDTGIENFAIKQSSELGIKPKTIIKTREAYSHEQPQSQEQIITVETPSIKVPKTTPPQPIIISTKTPDFLPPPLLKKGLRAARASRAYEVYVKRGGKFLKVDGLFPKSKALQKGELITSKTLAATFKIKPTGFILPQEEGKYTVGNMFRNYALRKGRKVPLEEGTFIQKAKYRLSSPSEVREIQKSRKMKNIMKSKGVRWI